MDELRVGDKFQTFEEFETKLHEFEQKHYIQLYKRDARTVGAARKRVSRPLSSEIKYYEIRYCCISGGAAFKARGHGIRETS